MASRLFQMACPDCNASSEEWLSYDTAKAGIPCLACEGSKFICIQPTRYIYTGIDYGGDASMVKRSGILQAGKWNPKKQRIE